MIVTMLMVAVVTGWELGDEGWGVMVVRVGVVVMAVVVFCCLSIRLDLRIFLSTLSPWLLQIFVEAKHLLVAAQHCRSASCW